MDPARIKAKELARDFLSQGRFCDWFEALYAGADGRATAIPWADLTFNPNVAEWVARQDLKGTGRKALVVGCGLGDDAEALADLGFDVVAFDIAPTAIDWCRRRFPNSAVHYCVADLLSPPEAWAARFDFVLECYTLQSLPPDALDLAMQRVSRFVALDGTLLVVCRARDAGEEVAGPPWPMAKEQLDAFVRSGLQEVSFEDCMDTEEPPVRRFRVCYRR